jgi:hypothetical protein
MYRADLFSFFLPFHSPPRLHHIAHHFSFSLTSLPAHHTHTLTVRRSSRQRLQPLEYWRNERVVYKRRQSGIAIEEVVRIPKAPAEPLAGKKKGGGGGPRSASAKVRVKSEQAPPEEEGVDDATDPDGIVWSWEGNAEVSRRMSLSFSTSAR